jgi:hypothetical protein
MGKDKLRRLCIVLACCAGTLLGLPTAASAESAASSMAVAPYFYNGSGGPGDDTCSGVDQQAWEFTKIFAGYSG